jgi:hypothetical protein
VPRSITARIEEHSQGEGYRLAEGAGSHRRRIQARMMQAINIPVRIVVGLRFATPPSGRLMLVFRTGGTTGKSPKHSVSYARQGTTVPTSAAASGS